MEIKKLEYDDIKLYKDTLKNYVEELITPYTSKEIPIEVERIYENMCNFTKDGTAIIMGALDKEDLLGFIWGYKKLEKNDTVHINYFFVNKNYRSRGIGSELLKSLIKNIEDNIELELLVNKKNLKAFQFYKRNEFKIIEENADDLKLCKLK